MVKLSSTKKEQLHKKLKIAEACLEGAKGRIEDYNRDDEVLEGLSWAFLDLKEAIEQCVN